MVQYNSISVEDFKTKVAIIIGTSAWGTIAGEGTGADVHLDFGGKVRRSLPVDNPMLTPEQQVYVGEFSLMIWCSWRIENRDGIVCGSSDSNEEGDAMLSGLHTIENSPVIDIGLTSPAMDLTMQFQNGNTLRIFCDSSDTEDKYCFFVDNESYTIISNGRIEIEKCFQ